MSRTPAESQITFWVDTATEKQLSAYCALWLVSKSDVMRKALELFINLQVEEELAKNKPKPAARAGSKPVPLVELDWN